MQFNRKLAAVAAAAVVLTGCAGAELAHLAYQATVEQFTIQYRTDTQGQKHVSWRHGFDAVQPMQYQRHFLREEANCTFTGVLIPWARTWPQEVRNGDNVTYIAPEPNEIAGYAAVVYRKQCSDQAAQAILHVGQQEDVLMVKREAKAGVLNNRPARAMDVLSGNQDFRPQWLPQVVERAVQLAPSNAAAKQFVLAAQPQLLLAVPELQVQIASVK